MNSQQTRSQSIDVAQKMGVEILPTLPFLDVNVHMRDMNEVVARMLIMSALAVVAYGFERKKAILWLKQEDLFIKLTSPEQLFILEDTGEADRFKSQIESLWALAWAMGMVEELDFTKDCDSQFARLFPDLTRNKDSVDFRKKIKPRQLPKVFDALDLAYCLHWALRQSELSGKPFMLKPHIVVYRRKALEWLLGKEDWEEVPLDT